MGASHLLVASARVHLMTQMVSGLGGHGVTLLLLALALAHVSRVHLLAVHAHGGGGLGITSGLMGHVGDATGGLRDVVGGLGVQVGGLGVQVGGVVGAFHVGYWVCVVEGVGRIGRFEKLRG